MAKILMITATSDNNRILADKFADAAREMGHEADVIDLVELDMPMFSVARSKELDVVPGMAELKEAMSMVMNLVIFTKSIVMESYQARTLVKEKFVTLHWILDMACSFIFKPRKVRQCI